LTYRENIWIDNRDEIVWYSPKRTKYIQTVTDGTFEKNIPLDIFLIKALR